MKTVTILKLILGSILAFLMPIGGLLVLIITMVVIDMFTGLYASYKEGTKITSNKFFNTPVKLFFYLITVIVAFQIDVFVFGGVFPLFDVTHGIAKGLTMIYMGVEVISIDENSQRLGNKPFKIILFSMLDFLKKLKKDLIELGKKE